MFYLSLFRKFLGISVRSQMEYHASFVLGVAAQILSYGFQFLSIWIMINAFGNLAGWSPMDILFLYSMNMFSYSIGASLAFNTSQQLSDIVRTGKFDDVLLKPMNSLVYMVSSNINIGYVTHFALGIIGMVFSLTMLSITLNPANFIWLGCVLIGGALIHFSFLIITSIPNLILINNTGWSIFYWGFTNFISYPLSIFGRPVQFLLTFILPYGFISFFPAQHFLNIQDDLDFSPVFQYLTPLVGLTLLIITFILWRWGINHYESSGS